MSLAVAGNSHVVALAAGNAEAGVEARIFALGNGRHEPEVFSRTAGGTVSMLVEQYAENLARHTGSATIQPDLTWGLLQVNHHARIYRDDTWLTWEPAAVCSPDRVPLSQGLLEQVMERDQLGVRRFFTDLSATGVDFFAVSAPPPRRDHPAIRRGVRPEVVRHIDATGRTAWANWLGEHGIHLVAPPQESWAADGFLEQQLAATTNRQGTPDTHHANATYGAAMMRAIADHVATRTRRSTGS